MLRLLLPLLLVCVLQLTAAVHTHQEYFSAPSAAGHKGECQDNKAGKSAKLGETWTTSGCKQATCVLRPDLNGEMALSITEDGCPILESKPGCRISSVSRTKQFPDCCPKLRCRSTTNGKVVTVTGGSSPPAVSRPPPAVSRPPPAASRPPPAASRPPPAVSRSPPAASRPARRKSTGQASNASRRKYPKYQPRN